MLSIASSLSNMYFAFLLARRLLTMEGAGIKDDLFVYYYIWWDRWTCCVDAIGFLAIIDCGERPEEELGLLPCNIFESGIKADTYWSPNDSDI